MKEKLDITLKIGGVKLNLNIDRAEEALLREVVRQINHAYDKYSELFSDSPSEEVLAKVTLLFARGFISLKSQVDEMDRLVDSLDQDFAQLLRKGMKE